MVRRKTRSTKKNEVDITKTPEFFEELTVLKAQELIAQLMAGTGVTKVELSRRLGQSKAHVTDLLADGRNLTLKTLGRVCFHLGSEVSFSAQDVNALNVQNQKYATVVKAVSCHRVTTRTSFIIGTAAGNVISTADNWTGQLDSQVGVNNFKKGDDIDYFASLTNQPLAG